MSFDVDDGKDPLFPVSSSTPSSAMKDSGFGIELLSPEPGSVSTISPGGDIVFDFNVDAASRTRPTAIPQRRKAPSTAQRHTNFTPPREYMSPVSVRRGSMTNFCVCGSLPRPLSLFMTDDDDVSFSFTGRISIGLFFTISIVNIIELNFSCGRLHPRVREKIESSM